MYVHYKHAWHYRGQMKLHMAVGHHVGAEN